jgi:four helix bundle protein
MTEAEFKRRTKLLGLQILRSGTSVGANYRAACRAQSPKDMIKKLRIVEEEADESIFWLELIGESGLMPVQRLKNLLQETNEILAMTVASIKTLQRKLKAGA